MTGLCLLVNCSPARFKLGSQLVLYNIKIEYSPLTITNSVSDPSHFDLDPDPDPGIHIWESGSGSSEPPFRHSGSVSGSKVDPDPSTYFSYFHKEIHVVQITILIFATANIYKRHFSDKKTFSFTFYST